MAVYFACRSPYVPPGGKHLKRFDDDTVLDWFRARWSRLSGTDQNAVYDRVDEELGCEVYSFPYLFVSIAEPLTPPPANASELADAMGAVYANDILCDSEHLLQVGTDDDEVGLAYYFFDDHYLALHGKHAAFLLQPDWRLPDGAGSGFRTSEITDPQLPRGRGKGRTWVVDLDVVGDLDELSPALQLNGVRLPDLARYLLSARLREDDLLRLLPLRLLMSVESARADPIEAAFLQGLREHPGDESTWNAYSDWLQERGERPAGLHLLNRGLTRLRAWENEPVAGACIWPEDDELNNLPLAYQRVRPITHSLDERKEDDQSLVHTGEHIAQFCYSERRFYQQWIVFDDLWAGAHRDLASAILKFVRRWDVLSPS